MQLVPLADPFEHLGLPELRRLDHLGDDLFVDLLRSDPLGVLSVRELLLEIANLSQPNQADV